MPKSQLRIRTVEQAHAEQLGEDPLRDSFVWWDDVTMKRAAALRRAIERATEEADMQRFLEQNPGMLIQHLGGGHGRWVVPHPRLGSQHVPDFVIGDQDSTGRQWVAVELEGPQRPMFNRSGDPSRYVWHAIRQIIDWRVWLEFNRDYAGRPPDEDGLGLEDISPSLPGLIIVGRRRPLDNRRKAFRRGLARQLNIEIHSYDWLVERAESRVASLELTKRNRDA
jgi:Domain of unknown function (DUF4263)